MLENLTDEQIKEAAKKYYAMVAVKALGDWEIEIRAVPYGSDGDSQTFDDMTDYMEETFSSPAIIYQHGIKANSRGKGIRGILSGESLESKPIIIGKAQGIEKRFDGVYVKAILDKTNEYAQRVWEAAKKGLAIASSDSITHLARLDVGDGRQIMYEKTRPGRITVWPLAGVSVWDSLPENFPASSPRAIALPAMKAIYRDAGIPFPEIDDTTGVSQADEKAQKRAEIIKQSKKLLKYAEKQRKLS